jgi:amidophosphoribosyltransferase
VLGRVDGALMVCSEESGIVDVGGQLLRHVVPGEMVIADGRGMVEVQPFLHGVASPCVQEVVQLCRASSTTDTWPVYQARTGFGEATAQTCPVAEGQVVVPLDRVSTPAAAGFARAIQVPLEHALVVSAEGVVRSAITEVVTGRRVVLVAASMGIGHTVRAAVEALNKSGAASVHVRIASPRLLSSCAYGVSGPTADELDDALAADKDEAASTLGAASLAWLSVERLSASLGLNSEGGQKVCTACLGGKPPIPVEPREGQLGLFGQADKEA